MKGTKSGKARGADIDESTVAPQRAWRAHRGSMSLDLVRGDSLVFGDLECGVRNVNSMSLMFTYRVREAQKALGADALK